MLILSIQIVVCGAVAGNTVCSVKTSMQQRSAAESLWVFSKPTSGDLESGRSGTREEAGRVRASGGSFLVYTGGINGKQQEKTECVCTSLRLQGLQLMHTQRLFINTRSVLQISSSDAHGQSSTHRHLALHVSHPEHNKSSPPLYLPRHLYLLNTLNNYTVTKWK